MILGRSIFYAALLGCATITDARLPAQLPQPSHTGKKVADFTARGCFNSLGIVISSQEEFVYNSIGSCIVRCKANGNTVISVQNKLCVCSDSLPARLAKIEENQCNTPCPGYPLEKCGGREVFSVYAAETEEEVEFEDYTGEDVSVSALTAAFNGVLGFSATAGQVAKAAQDFLSACLGRSSVNDEKRQRSWKPEKTVWHGTTEL